MGSALGGAFASGGLFTSGDSEKTSVAGGLSTSPMQEL